MTTFTITEDFPKSEVEFHARFSDPKACYQYLFNKKWPNGFVCKRCGNQQYWHSKRNLYICTKCQHQHSLTAGTIMDSSKSPINHWFLVKSSCASFSRWPDRRKLLGPRFSGIWTPFLSILQQLDLRRDPYSLKSGIFFHTNVQQSS